MEKQYEKKLTWTIKNFSSIHSVQKHSLQFVVGGSKWRVQACAEEPRTINHKRISLYLEVADPEVLPCGWKRDTEYCLSIVNHIDDQDSIRREGRHCFNQKLPILSFQSLAPLIWLLDEIDGFLVNDEIMIVAEVCVLEVVGKSDVVEEISLVNESMDVNGFQVLPKQIESVNTLLRLTEILSQSPEKLSNDDLDNAYSTLSYVTKAGFKLDWLEKKLKEVGETRLQEIKEELKNMKQKCAKREALLEFLR